jgi:transposase
MDRPAFDRYITEVLVPSLRVGQIVVGDNLAVHKSPVARAAIMAAGCERWFLPPYSPDYTPIEQAFSKLKQLLRRARPRSLEMVLEATQAAYGQIRASDCRGYFHHAGYYL